MKTLFEKMRDNRAKRHSLQRDQTMNQMLQRLDEDRKKFAEAQPKRLTAMQSNCIGSALAQEHTQSGWYGYAGDAGAPF
jgi:hypothetical protein